jgi:hypothetical protein
MCSSLLAGSMSPLSPIPLFPGATAKQLDIDQKFDVIIAA